MRDNPDVDDLLRRSTEAEVPPQVQARMRQRLDELRARVERPGRPTLLAFVRSLLQPVGYRLPAVASVLTVIILVIVFSSRSDGRVYAEAAMRLRAARALQYTIVLAPYVEVEFSYSAPARQRVNCSWGIEIRSDGSGSQLVLMHYAKSYVKETGKQDSLASAADFVRQLRELPEKADVFLGEQQAGDRTLVGYRVNRTAADAAASGAESLDLWLDARSGTLDHVDITTAGSGKPRYQMHIKDIRLDAAIDATLFDMTPPSGYTPIVTRGDVRRSDSRDVRIVGSQPAIRQVDPMTAVVVPMTGSYLQARAAVEAVAAQLQRIGVAPSGPPFGRFESEQHWDAGYPVASGTQVAAPFQLVTVPGGSVASVIIKGSWGQDSASRWSAFITWIGGEGYVAVGPPMETWSGEDGRTDTQTTEMRIAVRRTAR